jgi:energy-coupling factor transport system ATP-binding protein
MIRCEHLVFDYPDGTRALDGLDLAIERGERVAITGRNGSGKSTLVRLWNGLLRPTSGSVLIDGAAIASRPVAELARVVGMTFQDPDRQLFSRTCRKEVEFGARNVGLRGRALDAAVDGALDAVGLAPNAGANPSDLGGSRRRLLAIASVLAMQTPVVVLDEPTMGLDSDQVRVVGDVVARLAAQGRTVVAISHDARFIAGSFARAVRLEAGRVATDGPPGAVATVTPAG